MQPYLLGILCGLVAMFCLGIGDSIVRKSITQLGAAQSLFYRNLVISILLGAVVLSASHFRPTVPQLLFAIGIGVLAYLPVLFVYKAFKIGKMGVVKPVASAYIVFTALFSFIIFSEQPTLAQWVGIVALLIGVVLISVDFDELRNSELLKVSSGVPFALLAAVSWGLTFALYKIPIGALGAIPASFIVETMIFTCSALYLLTTRTWKKPSRSSLVQLTLVGILGATASIAFNFGVQYAGAGIVAALVGSNALVTTIYARIIDHETLTFKQYASVSIIILGVVIISMGG
jgi:drug/metabolite transporter (DMT)-like permease